MEFLRPKRPGLSLDLAPLIDVVFQLLIFFMLTTSFTNPALTLELPKAKIDDQDRKKHVVISMDSNGNIFVGNALVTQGDLAAKLESEFAKMPSRVVHLRGDQNMPYKFFVEVMDTARQAGARQINIVHKGTGAA